jgi:hypothetical protein
MVCGFMLIWALDLSIASQFRLQSVVAVEQPSPAGSGKNEEGCAGSTIFKANYRGRHHMNATIMIGRGNRISKIPRKDWEDAFCDRHRDFEARIGFMSLDHHLVRNFVVRQMPLAGEPLSPEYIAQNLNLPLPRIVAILDELEKQLTFLFRNEQGAVTWAYPVTLEKTPHHITFNTGERVYAA